jgi:hypothetical protein
LRLNVLVVSLTCLCLVAPSHAASAQRATQSSISLLQGSRVRVKAATMVAPLIANYLEQRGDTLVFIEEGRGPGVWSFAISQIDRLETTAGEGGRVQRYVARGAAYGAGAGAIGGLIFAGVASPSDSTKEYSRPLTALAGAAVGAGIGAIIGSRFKTERWVNVPIVRQLSFELDPRRGILVTIGGK